MHDYLRSIGFSAIRTKAQEDELVKMVVQQADEKDSVELNEHMVLTEFRKEFAGYSGIAVRGEFDGQHHFRVHEYYPYFIGSGVTSKEEIEIEKRSNQSAFAAICDDTRIGIPMVFSLQNVIPYLRAQQRAKVTSGKSTISALAKSGTVILPVQKSESEKKALANASKKRSKLIEEARQGNEGAIESLALEDIDLYLMLSQRVTDEDILSIVDTSFMPSGLESDEFYIIAEIAELAKQTNPMTNEDIWQMTVSCNNVMFDLCINAADLVGEPQIGRRFKGEIWLQGEIDLQKTE